MIWPLLAFFALFALALFGVAVWAHHLRESKRLRVREMIHDERMAALETGVALADLPSDLAEDAAPREESNGGGRWADRAALAAGLVLTCGGLGVSLGFRLVPDTPQMGGMQDLATLGLIPLLVGVGFLLFAWIERWSRRGERR